MGLHFLDPTLEPHASTRSTHDQFVDKVSCLGTPASRDLRLLDDMLLREDCVSDFYAIGA